MSILQLVKTTMVLRFRGVEAEFSKKDGVPDLNEGWAPCSAPLHGPQILHHIA
jgi:hypothetical protein